MRRTNLRVMTGLLWICLAMGPGPLAAAAPETGAVVVLTVEGIIDPVTSRYVEREMREAEQASAGLVVIMLDTPGGLDNSMRVITKQLVNRRVPSAVYVAPSGGRAASAGAFIGMAATRLAMAPATNLGAAHPVDLQGKQASTKITNDSAAYIASLARLRNRPEEVAIRMVRASLSLTAEEAVRQGVADMIAPSLPELLALLQGQTVTQAGRSQTLQLAGRPVQERPMAWTEKFLHLLTNPNLAYVLFLIGLYGIIYELAAPGTIFPGVVGAVSLLLALMGFEGLPVSYVGIALIGLGAVLMVMEIFIVSSGLLAAGGAVALILGSFMLLPSELPVFRVAASLLWTMAGLSLAFVAALVMIVLRNRRPAVAYTGVEQLVGSRGWVKSAETGNVVVHLSGEDWSAMSDQPLAAGQAVEVVAVEGLHLRVRPV